MVGQKSEVEAVAEAKARLVEEAERATLSNYVRSDPAEALMTAFVAGLALGTSRETMGNILKGVELVKDFMGKR